VLIADDEPFNVMALEGMLELSNVACDIVFDGYSAIESLEMNLSNK
jgi:CheY-like chemotaxis protein